MRVITESELPTFNFQDTIVVIGNFDGVHLGHIKLINSMIKLSKELSLKPVVLTFTPHPSVYYNRGLSEIYCLRQKNESFSNLNISECVYLNFNYNLSQLTAEQFFYRYIVSSLGARALIVGDDFRFGRERDGDVGVLERLCAKEGISLYVESKLVIADTVVSSTVIRELIASGNVGAASMLLGRDYSCMGTVVNGDKMGRLLNFPTANLSLFTSLMPCDGIYAGYLKIFDKLYGAMVYIGIRPTIENKTERRFEVYIIDFDSMIYGMDLEVFLLEKIRESEKFEGLTQLINQMEKDLLNTKELLRKRVTWFK